MIRYIFKCAKPVWTTEYVKPGNWETVGDLYHICLSANNPPTEILTYPPIAAVNPEIIGGWDKSGDIVYTVNEVEYLVLRPLGNNPDGSATTELPPPNWQGTTQPCPQAATRS